MWLPETALAHARENPVTEISVADAERAVDVFTVDAMLKRDFAPPPLNGHHVLIIGGAAGGSTAALELADRGYRVTVIEQDALPHGKVTDGIPSHHVGLRGSNIQDIYSTYTHPHITFIPSTMVDPAHGLSLGDLQKRGYSAIFLAIGAQRDRPLEFPDSPEAHALFGRGRIFEYQNDFMQAINHWDDAGKNPKEFPLFTNTARQTASERFQKWKLGTVRRKEGLIDSLAPEGEWVVIGGGLASIDCMKELRALEVYTAVETLMQKQGHQIDRSFFHDIQDKGILGALEKYGIFRLLGIEVDKAIRALPNDTRQDIQRQVIQKLGLRAARLIYRGNAEDMSLDKDDVKPLKQRIAALHEEIEAAKGTNTEGLEQALTKPQDELQKIQTRRARNAALFSEKFFFDIEEKASVVSAEQFSARGQEYTVLNIRTPHGIKPIRVGKLISSIGSVPDPVHIEIATPDGAAQTLIYDGTNPASLQQFENLHIFGIANFVTGKGNLDASREDARQAVRRFHDTIAPTLPVISADSQTQIADFGTARQRAVGYDGNLAPWIVGHGDMHALEEWGWIIPESLLPKLHPERMMRFVAKLEDSILHVQQKQGKETAWSITLQSGIQLLYFPDRKDYEPSWGLIDAKGTVHERLAWGALEWKLMRQKAEKESAVRIKELILKTKAAHPITAEPTVIFDSGNGASHSHGDNGNGTRSIPAAIPTGVLQES